MRRECHEWRCKPGGEAPEGQGRPPQPSLQKHLWLKEKPTGSLPRGLPIRLRAPSLCRRRKLSDTQAPRRKGVQAD